MLAAIIATRKSLSLISGSATGKASDTALLKAAGRLLGATSGKTSDTALLKAFGSLAGTAAGRTSASAALSSFVFVVGSAQGKAATTAVLKASGYLIGTASGKAVDSGTLKGAGKLAGAGTGKASDSGTLKGLGSLLGTSTGKASDTGLLKGLGVLLGTASGQASTEATLSGGLSEIFGSTLGLAIASGSLKGFGSLFGTAFGKVSAEGTLTTTEGAVSGSVIGHGFAFGTISSFKQSKPSGSNSSINSLISEPIYIGTASNDVQMFKRSATASEYFDCPSGQELTSKQLVLVASGYASIPPSAINSGANLYLTLRGYDQGFVPRIAPVNNVMSYPLSQGLAPGLYPWQMFCRFSFTSEPIWVNRSLLMNYTFIIGGSVYSDVYVSTNNPFLVGLLQFSFGIQFSGTVSGTDIFEAAMLQFEVQQV